MRRRIGGGAVLIIALAAAGGGETADPDYPLRPVPFTAVRVNDV